MKSLVILFCVLGVPVARTVTIDSVGVATEGNNLTIICNDEANAGNDFLLLENGVQFGRNNSPSTQRNGTARNFQLPVDRTKNGNMYRCEDVIAGMMSEVMALTVTPVPQVIITNPPQSTLVTEGNNATFDCTVEDNGSPATVGWLFTPSGSSSGIALATGTNVTGIEMVTVSGGLRTMLTFSGVRREANGGTVECIAATDRSKPMNLTVQWPPTVNSEESITLQQEASYPLFSVNFTEGNPRSNMIITGPSQPGNTHVSISSVGVVNITMVQDGDAGAHVATWNNGIGDAATFTLYLTVEPPPTAPSPPTVVNVGAIVGGTVGGSVVAVIICCCIGGVVVWYCYCRKKKRSSKDDQVKMKKKTSSEDEEEGD